MISINYRTAFVMAVVFHLILVMFLVLEKHHDSFVEQPGKQNRILEAVAAAQMPSAEPIKAVSVDSQAVEETINRLRQDRAEKQAEELNQQKMMQQRLRVAEQKRIQEQRQIERLKKQEQQMALAQKQRRIAEEKHLQELAKQKDIQEKHLADLKQQQQKLKQQEAEQQRQLAAAQQKKVEAAAAEARLEQAKKTALAAQQSARMAGEVNKYKALIIQSISRHWILPEHVNRQLYSQFRIRLAPNGAVLSVNLTRSSGDPVLDRSAQAAIYKASPLPVPEKQEVFNLFRDISLTVRPESARG